MQEDRYAVLKISDFRNYVFARFFAVIAVQIQRVVVGWQVYSLTNDTFAIGLVSLCEIIPSISISFISGFVADIIDRRRIILASCTLLLFCSIALLITTLYELKIFESQVYVIYLIIFISGIARGFLHPSLAAFMAQLVPKQYYPYSSAWNSISWQIGAVIGPLLGGILYAFSDGPKLGYITDSTLLSVAILFYFLIQPKSIPEKKEKESLWYSLTSGFKFVFSNQLLLGAMSLDLFAVLFGGAVALLPAFAKDVLNIGPEGLGYLRSAPAVGAAFTAVTLANFPIKENAGKKLLFAVAGFGVSMILFALSKELILSLLFLALSGMFDSVSVVLRSTIVQTFTPDQMRGRVASVNSIFIGSSNEIGDFESGTAAKFMGLVPSVIFGGCMTLLVVLITSFKAPKLRDLNFGIDHDSDKKN
jgi:MFS family permease